MVYTVRQRSPAGDLIIPHSTGDTERSRGKMLPAFNRALSEHQRVPALDMVHSGGAQASAILELRGLSSWS